MALSSSYIFTLDDFKIIKATQCCSYYNNKKGEWLELALYMMLVSIVTAILTLYLKKDNLENGEQ